MADHTTQPAQLDEHAVARVAATAGAAMIVVEPDTLAMVWANEQAEATFAPADATLLGNSALDHVHPDDLPLAAAATELIAAIDAERFADEGTTPAVYRLRTADGTYRWFEVDGVLTAGLLADEPDRALTVMVVHDAQRLEAMTGVVARIAAGEPSARTVADLVAAHSYLRPQRLMAVSWTDDDGDRRTEAGVLPPALAASDHPDDPWNRAVVNGETITTTRDELRPELQDLAREVGVSVCVTLAVTDPAGGRPACIIGWAPTETGAAAMRVRAERDMVPLLGLALERRHHLRRLTDAATRDSLTGLHNRRELLERLEVPPRPGPRRAAPALLFCDLDGFKEINDTHGHAAGDQVLVAVAERLGELTRATDLTARLGGDEFAVVLTDGAGAAEAVALADRILAAFAEPIDCRLAGRPVAVRVGVSIGIAVPGHGVCPSADRLLSAADGAMYNAKRAGANRYHLVALEPPSAPAR